MPKYHLYWTEKVENAYHTLQPIEAENEEEAWDIFWTEAGAPGFDYEIFDFNVVDLCDCEAEEVE